MGNGKNTSRLQDKPGYDSLLSLKLWMGGRDYKHVNAKRKMHTFECQCEKYWITNRNSAEFQKVSGCFHKMKLINDPNKYRNQTDALKLDTLEQCEKSMSSNRMFNIDHILIHTFHCLVLTEVEMMDTMREMDELSQKCPNRSKWSNCMHLSIPKYTPNCMLIWSNCCNITRAI